MTNIQKNILLLLGSIVFSMTIIELSLGFYYSMHPQTTGICAGKICKSWVNKNWRVNSLGFRDKQWKFPDAAKGALFIGDSITAGFGVKENERYSNIAASKNNSKVLIYNAGENHTDTLDQHKNLKKLTSEKISPDFVVYQYFGNDIEYLLDLDWALKLSTTQKIARYFIENSFLFDQFLRPFYLTKFSRTYHNNLVAIYKNPKIFSKHQENILKIMKDIRQIGAKNIFIVFPMLGSKELFNQTELLYVKQVKQLFIENCYPGDKLVNISSLIKSIPPDKWTASKFDSHPSSRLHELIGQTVADAFDDKKNNHLKPCLNKIN